MHRPERWFEDTPEDLALRALRLQDHGMSGVLDPRTRTLSLWPSDQEGTKKNIIPFHYATAPMDAIEAARRYLQEELPIERMAREMFPPKPRLAPRPSRSLQRLLEGDEW